MNWFLVILAILGIIMGIVPGSIADNIKKCAEEPGRSAREAASSRICLRLWIFGVAIWLSCAVLTFQVTDSLDKENKEMKSRIEALEKQISQTDTTTVNIQSL